MKNLSRKYVMPAALVAGFSLAPVLAHAELSVGNMLGTTVQEVSAALEGQGYTVSKIEMEDGEIEAAIMAENKTFEIEVDATTGKVVELERDDEDGDE